MLLHNFVESASPLRALQKKKVTFRQTDIENIAFQFLTEKLTSDSALISPHLAKPFQVLCYGYGNSIGDRPMQNSQVVAYENLVTI